MLGVVSVGEMWKSLYIASKVFRQTTHTNAGTHTETHTHRQTDIHTHVILHFIDGKEKTRQLVPLSYRGSSAEFII